MDIKTYIQDRRLSTTLEQFEKFASHVGEFSNVLSEDVAAIDMRMAKEMAALPKYSGVINSLRECVGVVNFVTGNEFGPLVERILHMAFPLSGSSVYHMGLGNSIPGEYIVDAREYFAPAGAPRPEQLAILSQLEDVVLGKAVTPIRELIEGRSQASSVKDFDKACEDSMGKPFWEKLKSVMKSMTDAEEALERGSIKNKMMAAYQNIMSEYENRAYNAYIRQYNRGKPKDKQRPEAIARNDSVVSKLRSDFTTLREQYLAAKAAIPAKVLAPLAGDAAQGVERDPDFARIQSYFTPKRDAYSHQVVRDNNGFIDYNPSTDIKKITNSVIEAVDAYRQDHDPVGITRSAINLWNVLKGYTTGDATVVRLKNQILDILGDMGTSNPEKQASNAINMVSKWSEIHRMLYEMINKVQNHGSVILMSNVDYSSLVSASKNPDDQKMLSSINSVLDKFNRRMEADFSRGRTSAMPRQDGGRAMMPRKAMVLISSSKIDNLQTTETVELGNMPVDAEEAEIIVRNIMEYTYEKDYRDINYFRMAHEVEKQKPANRDAAMSNVDAHLDSMWLTQGKPMDDTIKEIQEMIIGLGQAQAIQIVKQTIKNAITTTYDEETQTKNGVQLDANKWVKECIEQSNKIHDENVPGMKSRRAKVAFEDYVFKKTGEHGIAWSNMIGQFGQVKAEYQILRQYIHALNVKIGDIDRDLSSTRQSEQSKIEKETLKAGYYTERNRAIIRRDMLLRSMPHFIVLYGKPGVGKTVWSDALADLFGFPIREINFQETKEKWYGETGRKTVKLMNIVKNSRNTVFLLDELDRDIEMQGEGSVGGGGAGGGHSVDKGMTKTLLTTFEEEQPRFINNNVFVIITTNYLGSMDKALLSRTKGNIYKVEAPDDPADYKRFIDSFLHTEMKDTPDAPWLTEIVDSMNKQGVGVNIKDYWTSLQTLLSSVDLNKLCEIIAKRELGFRTTSGVIRMAVMNHNAYMMSKRQIERGERTDIIGMPFTTENLIHAANIAKDDDDKNENNLYGVRETAAELDQRINKRLKDMKLQATSSIEIIPPAAYTPEQVEQLIATKKAQVVPSGQFSGMNEIGFVYLVDANGKPDQKKKIAKIETNLVTGETAKKFAFPPNFNLDKEMNWVDVATPEQDLYNVGEDVIANPNDPTQTRRVPKITPKQPPAGKTMDELKDSGFSDVTPPVGEVPDETEQKQRGKLPPTEKQDAEKIAKASSTTDYYYNFIMQNGLLNKVAQVGTQVGVQPQAVAPAPFDDVEKFGVYYAMKGQVFIAPAGVEEKPIYLSGKGPKGTV